VQKQDETYPKEVFLLLDNNEFFLGRIILHQIGEGFSAEIDIVHSETKKIYEHVGVLHQLPHPQEGLDLAVQKLSAFLRKR
jgi:hypothetical protein